MFWQCPVLFPGIINLLHYSILHNISFTPNSHIIQVAKCRFLPALHLTERSVEKIP